MNVMSIFGSFWKARASHCAHTAVKKMRGSLIWMFAFMFMACTPIVALADFFGDDGGVEIGGGDADNEDALDVMPWNTCNVTSKVAGSWLAENVYVSSIKTNFEQLLGKWDVLTKDLFVEENLTEEELLTHKLPPEEKKQQEKAKGEFSKIGGQLFRMAKKYAAKRYEDCTRCELMNDWGYLFYLTQNQTAIRSFVSLNTLKYTKSDYIKIKGQAKIDDIELSDLTKAQIDDRKVQHRISKIRSLVSHYNDAPADKSTVGIKIKFGLIDRQATQKCVNAVFDKNNSTFAACTKKMYQPLFKYAVNRLMIDLSKVAKPSDDKKLIDVRKKEIDGKSSDLTCLPITEKVTKEDGSTAIKPGLFYYTQFIYTPTVVLE